MAESKIERKLAAILFADVVGYTRHSRRDEEGTHRALSASLDTLSDAVSNHGGRVVNFAGDAVLADFSSVVAALACAVEFQRGLTDSNADKPDDNALRFRVGINLGDVIVDRENIYGDGVNVAARLQEIAQEGGICISGAAFDQVGNRADYGFEYLGGQKVKNIAEPVRSYRVRLEPELAGRVLDETVSRQRRKLVTPGRIAASILTLILIWAVWNPQMPSFTDATVTVPTLAVIPFRTIGGAEDPEVFSQGLTEDLITALSSRQALRVVVVNPSTPDAPVDPKLVGREYNAQYLLEGSVRAADGKVRITAQLVDVSTGIHLWGARYDRPAGDVLAQQSEVTSRIVTTLGFKLAEAQSGVRTSSGSAGLLFGLGMEYLGRIAKQAIFLPVDLYNKVTNGEPAQSLMRSDNETT